ncbi:squalene synthase isoform 3-T3 [Molossus nigricans]
MEFVKCLGHPEEFYNLLRFRIGGQYKMLYKMDQDSLSSGLKTCYKYLHQTSRSFSVVIQALDEELRHAVCIFYLILRALDTLEDDMTISIEKKVPLLHNFHSYLYEPDWRFMESKEKDRQVLEDFPTISLEFRKLALKYQTVIANSSRKMGFGMAEFLNKQVTSEEEWDKYCHYVAGLVGIGLSQLFSASELEDPVVGNDLECANSMGLFLQKTNIIRDYLDDHKSGREFWPQEVWSKYVKKLGDFAKPENIDLAVQCMNELITNALRHIPDVITYLSRLRNQSVFNFCAIPQVMAIATLATCYNNQQVFKGVVKIRKGQTVTLMMDATNMPAVKAIIDQYMEEDIGAAQDFGGALNEARLEFLSRIIVFELGEMLEANQASCLQVRSVKLRLVYANTLSN